MYIRFLTNEVLSKNQHNFFNLLKTKVINYLKTKIVSEQEKLETAQTLIGKCHVHEVV